MYAPCIFKNYIFIMFTKTCQLYALILSERNRNDSSSSSGSDYRRAGGKWEYDETSSPSEKIATSTSMYPVVPASGHNNEFRPRIEKDIQKVKCFDVNINIYLQAYAY